MSEKVPRDVVLSRRIIIGMALLLTILLGSLAWGAFKSFSFPG